MKGTFNVISVNVHGSHQIVADLIKTEEQAKKLVKKYSDALIKKAETLQPCEILSVQREATAVTINFSHKNFIKFYVGKVTK